LFPQPNAHPEQIGIGRFWLDKYKIKQGDWVKLTSINENKNLTLKARLMSTKGKEGHILSDYLTYFPNIPEITEEEFDDCAFINKVSICDKFRYQKSKKYYLNSIDICLLLLVIICSTGWQIVRILSPTEVILGVIMYVFIFIFSIISVINRWRSLK